jgi:hypothetical protein
MDCRENRRSPPHRGGKPGAGEDEAARPENPPRRRLISGGPGGRGFSRLSDNDANRRSGRGRRLAIIPAESGREVKNNYPGEFSRAGGGKNSRRRLLQYGNRAELLKLFDSRKTGGSIELFAAGDDSASDEFGEGERHDAGRGQ